MFTAGLESETSVFIVFTDECRVLCDFCMCGGSMFQHYMSKKMEYLISKRRDGTI